MQDLKNNLKRTAQLCKNDLTTKMVDEFPELQGTIGNIYTDSSTIINLNYPNSKLTEEPEIVSKAIYEHYLPMQADGDLPKTKVGSIISVVDKLDNIVGMLSIGHIPTSSQDPHALRRQANGIIFIILNLNLSFPLSEMIGKTYELYRNQISNFIQFSREGILKKVKDFFLDKLKAYLVSLEHPYCAERVSAF
jgi:glycyl-tRNA synthetase beta chain